MSDERLLTLVGCTHGVVLEFDAEIRYLNAWADDPVLLARPAAELRGLTIDDVLGPAGAPLTAMVKRVYETGLVEHSEYPIQLPDGPRWFIADFKRVESGDGRRTVVMFARDITDRKATEQALARSEERYRLATQATNDVMWDCDLAADTVMWNPSLTTMLGYSEVETPVSWWKDRVHPDDRAGVLGSLQFALAHGATAWSERYRFLRANGTYAELVDRGFIVRDATGAACRLVGSMTDVTLINRLQAQLLEADRLSALGTLAAGVGHEINNPLSYVIGNLDSSLELLADDNEVTGLVKDALQGAHRIASIVKSLKMFTRSDESVRRVVELHPILDAAIQMADKEIRNRARLVRDFGPVPRVSGNESQLAQVFLNLLINAAQAIPEGDLAGNTICVTTRVDSNGSVIVAIQDSGAGIPAENVARVFDPFFTTKSVGGGTGLGLSISHRLVADHGGTMAIASHASGGTTVTVALPGHVEAANARPRVLVIDDEVQIGRLVGRMLRHNADVVAVTSARDGLTRLAAEHFDVVLCDLMMPEMTGMDLYDEVRRDHPELLRRLYFISGGAFTARAQEFLDTPGVACLEKPLDRARLLSLLPGAAVPLGTVREIA